MADPKDMLEVHVNVEMPASALKAIVENAKKIAGTDASGKYRLDTAAKTGEMISRFLEKYNFESFVKDTKNFS